MPNPAWVQAHAAGAATRLPGREEGQTMAEYGVALTIITIVILTAISLLSDRVVNTITTVANVLPGN